LIVYLFFEKDLLKIADLALPFIGKINDNKRPLILVLKVVQMLREVAASLNSKLIEVSIEENKAFAMKLIPVNIISNYIEKVFLSSFKNPTDCLKKNMFLYLLISKLIEFVKIIIININFKNNYFI